MSKPRVLLVKPPYKVLQGVYEPAYIPLGLAYLSAYLRSHGYETLMYNGDACAPADITGVSEAVLYRNRRHFFSTYSRVLTTREHPVLQEYDRVLQTFRPDIIGLSVLSNETGAAALLSERSKQQLPRVPIVWGGAHPTFQPRNVLKHYPWVDYLVLGEGEVVLKHLCDVLGQPHYTGRLAEIRGIAFRSGKDSVITPVQPLIANLDDLPFPDFHSLAFPERYRGLYMGNMLASRGCPYRCGFCSSRSFWRRKVRFRSYGNIIEEIRFRMQQLTLRHFTFVDDSFTIQARVIRELAEHIIQQKLPFFWGTMTRADLVDAGLVKLMKRANCIHLHFGIETGSPETAKQIHKDLDLDVARRSIAMVRDLGIPVGTFFIIGFPEETEAQMNETFQYMRSIRPSRIGFNIFEPQPGASLYELLVQKGVLDATASWENMPMFPMAHYMLHLDAKRFRELADTMAAYVHRYNNRLATKLQNYRVDLLRRLLHDPSFYWRKLRGYVKRRLHR